MRLGIYFREADPLAGGGFTFEGELLKEIVTRDRHELVFLGPSGAALDRLTAKGFATLDIPISGVKRIAMKAPDLPRVLRKLVVNPTRRISAMSRLDRVIASARFDFLWCLGPDVPSMEVPYAMTVWDLQHRLQPYFPEVSASGVWLQRERYYETRLRRAALVITGTEAGKEEVERFYSVPSQRILVLPHPTPTFPETSVDDDDVIARHGLQPGYLFYPARLWPHKNHVGLLHALKALEELGFSPKLVLTGSDWGGNRDHVLAVARDLGIADRVRFLGFVSRSDLRALYRRAACLTYVSYFGPENLPPLEAFSLGCPVVAARVAGAEEQLGDAAFLVDPSDHVAIAEAIAQTLDDERLRGTLVTRGYERAARVTPQAFVDGALDALERFGDIRRNWGSGP